MLKKSITYTDYNDQEQTRFFYFNLTKAELIRMEVRGGDESYQDRLMRIVKSDNKAEIVAEFEQFILSSYGVRTADGQGFTKSPELLKEFKETAAYDELLMSFFTGDDAGSDFINGIMPKSLIDQVNEEMGRGPTARERSEANMQGHLTKAPTAYTPEESAALDAQDQATVDFGKAERRRALQQQLDELND